MSEDKPMKSLGDLIKDTALERKCHSYLGKLRLLMREALQEGIILQIEQPFIEAEAVDSEAVLPKNITAIDGFGLRTNLKTNFEAPGIKKEVDIAAEFLVARFMPNEDNIIFAVQYRGDDKPFTRFNGEEYIHKEKKHESLESQGAVQEDGQPSPGEHAVTEGQPTAKGTSEAGTQDQSIETTLGGHIIPPHLSATRFQKGLHYVPQVTTGMTELSFEERRDLIAGQGNYMVGFVNKDNAMERADLECLLDNERIPTHREDWVVLETKSQFEVKETK